MRPDRLLMLFAGLTFLAATVAGCSCGGDGSADAGPGPSAACPVPGATSTWHLVNGGVSGPAADPGACRTPIELSALAASSVQSLGVHTVGDVVRFTVGPQTGTISIVSQASSGVPSTISLTSGTRTVTIANSVVPTNLRNPSGALLYDDSATPPVDGSNQPVWYAGLSQFTGTMTLPNTTAALAVASQGYPTGSWSFTVNDYGYECTASAGCDGGSTTAKYDITVLTRPLAHSTGTIDLSFYLVTNALTAAQAITDTHVLRYVNTLSTLYAEAGLCLGAITFYDVPAWARAKYATGVTVDGTSECDPLRQLFTLSQPTNGLHVFLVDALSQEGVADAGVLVGIDGTVPGPATVGGTLQSGVVVNFSDYASGSGCTGVPNFAGSTPCGADLTAYITAHEGGHFMGLYHTTESFGSHDPLADTATCACSAVCGVPQSQLACCVDPTTGSFAGTCASGQPTYLFGTYCRTSGSTCSGAQSLMFWTLDEKSVGTLTTQQGQVVRSNPIVY